MEVGQCLNGEEKNNVTEHLRQKVIPPLPAHTTSKCFDVISIFYFLHFQTYFTFQFSKYDSTFLDYFIV